MPLTLRRLPSTRTELGNFKAILTAGAPSCPRSHSQFYKVIIMDIFEKCIKLGDFKVILTAGLELVLALDHIHSFIQFSCCGSYILNIFEKRIKLGNFKAILLAMLFLLLF